MRLRAQSETWSEKKIAQYVREGRGQGQGADYQPWIRTQRALGSAGENHRYAGIVTGGREHHLISGGEADVFFLLEWSPFVVDIREQYPFDRGVSQAIALQGGLRHPCYRGTNIPCVMTLDFLVNLREDGEERLCGISVKTASDLESETTLTTLELERRICASINASYRLVISDLLDRNVTSNVRLMRQSLPSPIEAADVAANLHMFGDRVITDLRHRQLALTLSAYCAQFDSLHGLSAGFTLRVMKNLMWHRRITFDLAVRELAMLPLTALQVHEAPVTNLRVVGL